MDTRVYVGTYLCTFDWTYDNLPHPSYLYSWLSSSLPPPLPPPFRPSPALSFAPSAPSISRTPLHRSSPPPIDSVPLPTLVTTVRLHTYHYLGLQYSTHPPAAVVSGTSMVVLPVPLPGNSNVHTQKGSNNPHTTTAPPTRRGDSIPDLP